MPSRMRVCHHAETALLSMLNDAIISVSCVGVHTVKIIWYGTSTVYFIRRARRKGLPACPGQVKISKSQFGQVILTLYLPDRAGKHLQCDRYSIAKTHQQSLTKQKNSLPVMSSLAGHDDVYY